MCIWPMEHKLHGSAMNLLFFEYVMEYDVICFTMALLISMGAFIWLWALLTIICMVILFSKLLVYPYPMQECKWMKGRRV